MSCAIPDRVLVVGSGSIAARHVRNLLGLGVSEVLVVTRRDLSSAPDFQDGRISVAPDLPEDCPRIAIVASDTDRHVAAALRLVRRDAHVLIEKPVAPAVDDDLRLLASEARDRALVVRVAYNLRFLPVFREIERFLREAVIGQTLFVRIEAGQHLGAWRPARPYALGYSASSARGGGVALDLSHELDYMRMLFGHPIARSVHHGCSESLGIESPDMFDAIYELPGGAVCSVHLDYLEPALRRRMRIVGTNSVIECDLAAQRLSVQGEGVSQRLDEEALFDTGRTYVTRSSRSCPRCEENGRACPLFRRSVTERRSSSSSATRPTLTRRREATEVRRQRLERGSRGSGSLPPSSRRGFARREGFPSGCTKRSKGIPVLSNPAATLRPGELDISIVVPAFNEAANIQELIRRTAAVQRLGAFEVILVDDGSTDGRGT